MRDWDGKRYWLVGASEGLGRAVAERLSRMGVELVLSARSEDQLRELKESLPGRAHVVPLDVTDREAVRAAHADAEAAVGELDGFAYLAGAYWPMKAQDWDTDKVETMLEVNLMGLSRCLGEVVPAFLARDRGHIVLTGSLSAFRGPPGAIGYGMSKSAIHSLATSLDLDLKNTGIEVQVIHPGFIRTRLTDKNDFTMPQIMEPGEAAAEFVEHMGTDAFQKAYPVPMSWIFRVSGILPHWLYRWIMG